MNDCLQGTQYMNTMPMQTCEPSCYAAVVNMGTGNGAVTALAFWKSVLVSDKTRVIASRQ